MAITSSKMLCLKKRRTYSFTQGACADLPRRSNKDNNRFDESLNMAITTLPRKNRSREERPSRMVLTVTEDTPADMLAGSMDLLVQLPRENNSHTQRVTVQRSTPMMDLLVQIATAHKLAASSYTLQAIGERGLVLPHQPNTPIGALDALQVKLLPKQGTFLPRKTKQANQPFETTFRLQVHLPRNQLYVSRVSPKMNLGEILDEVCREKNLDRNKYELRHPANLEETLDLSLSLQDYHLQEVTLYAKQGRSLGSALSTQDIMALQRQEERRRQQAKQGVFGFIFKKSKESSLSTDSLGGRSVSPARSDETGRSASPLAPPARPQRKRRPAPKPPVQTPPASTTTDNNNTDDNSAKDKDKEKMVISHSRNSSDSSGYHEASVLSDNPDSAAARLPETLPRRSRLPNGQHTPRKLAQTSQASKSLGNLVAASGSLGHAVSSTSLSSTGLRKKRAAPPPPVSRPLSSAISTQALERIVDSEESLTSDMDPSKPPSDIGAPSKASSDIDVPSKANSDLGIGTLNECQSRIDTNLRGSSPREQQNGGAAAMLALESSRSAEQRSFQKPDVVPVDDPDKIESSRVPAKRGKLVHSPGSLEDNLPSYSFVSNNSLEYVLEAVEGCYGNSPWATSNCSRRFSAEKEKLQARIKEYRMSRSSESMKSGNSEFEFYEGSCSSRNFVSAPDSLQDGGNKFGIFKSKSFASRDVPLKRENFARTSSLQQTREPRIPRSFISDDYRLKVNDPSGNLAAQSRLMKVTTSQNLNLMEKKSLSKKETKSSSENPQFLEVPDFTSYDPGANLPQINFTNSPETLTRMATLANLRETGNVEQVSRDSLVDNYICNDQCRAKMLKHSQSFQTNVRLRETKVVSDFEKTNLLSSRSFSTKRDFLRDETRKPYSLDLPMPRLGDISTTKCYSGSLLASCRDLENNLSPPPLSNLQIFAISTKPVDIQVAPMDSIPSEIDKLPSLPMIPHSNSKTESEKKLSILEPPPPGLVSREESNENWIGEVAPLPAPRKTGPESSLPGRPVVPKRRYLPSVAPRTSRPASQVSVGDETTSDSCPRDDLAGGQEVHADRLDPAMKITDASAMEGPAEGKDTGEKAVESFSKEAGKMQGNVAEEEQEFITFSAGEKRREEVKRVAVDVSEDLGTGNTDKESGVKDVKEDKCENMIDVTEETKVIENSVAEYSKYSTAANLAEDKSNEVYEAININDDDISISENSYIDSKPKLNAKNRTCSMEFDAESTQRSPTITQAVNNKMVLNRDSSSKSQSLDTEMEPEKRSQDNKSREISLRAVRQAKSMNDIHDVDSEKQEKLPPKRTNTDDKKLCMIVSTIPKCDHFEVPDLDTKKRESHEILTKSRTLSVDDLNEAEKNTAASNSEVSSPRRTKIYRSQSEFRDFEESSFKKQRKHLTSHAQDFAFALNFNLPATASTMRDDDREISRVPLTGRSEKPENLSETDILLQKVSDTLSSTLPASSSPVPEIEKPSSTETEPSEIIQSTQSAEVEAPRNIVNGKDEPQRANKIITTANETNPNVNSANATINSQQDTSDYVSAMSDDLSITDWEYQLPDPPSAFRDSNTPVTDGYDTITLKSVDAFQETRGPDLVEGHAENDTTDFARATAPIRSESFVDKREVKAPQEGEPRTKEVQRTTKTENRLPVKRSNSEPRPQVKTVSSNLELKKEVISELENKIETGCLPAGKEPDFRKTVDSTPAIAPVENPLSNFTITTYARQKSLNIFEEVHEQQEASKFDERVIKTFATLSRNKNLTDSSAEKYTLKNSVSSNGFEPKKAETKNQGRDELANKWQAINGEKEVRPQQQKQRNNDVKRDVEKSENMKNARNDDVSKPEVFQEKKFSTGLTAEAPRNKEKFALWRDNILNRQEEPTKEKQLQSIQVLKSILPQLKQTQQTEENVSEECNKLPEKKRLEMRSIEHSADANVVSTQESQAESEQKTSTTKERVKQYTYTGPPAISLGSWSERPCVNVQIKTDTDYKFGKSNTSGTRTLVNLNSRDQTDSVAKANEEESSSRLRDASQDVKRTIRSQPTTLERKEPDEFTRKLITHTTASGFKKPTLNKVSVVEARPKSEEKPIVMGVELKKSFVERQESAPSSDGNEIDTRPVNFKELTKTFGQEVCFRAKPKRVIQNRQSDCFGKPAENGSSKPNGHVFDHDPIKSNSLENGSDLRARRYTSVVGINNSLNQSYGQQAANHCVRNNVRPAKVNQPMPVVKGFNFQTETRGNVYAAQNGFNAAETIKRDSQKPSTVPVITGVTLKSASARPKSMPVNVDQRDILLESIRNFGGSKKLKSVAARF